jgi:putative membrane protein
MAIAPTSVTRVHTRKACCPDGWRVHCRDGIDMFCLTLRGLRLQVAFRLAAALLAALPSTASAHREGQLGGAAPLPQDLWRTWNDDWWLWLLMIAVAALYALGVRRIWAEAGGGRGIGRWRVWSFGAGWGALFIALLSPLDPLGGALFSAHMLQHEVMMLLAAPLLAVGRPLGAFVWGLPPRWRRPAWFAVRAGGLQASVRWLSRPLVAWSVHAAALWIWHVPALFERAVQSEPVHVAQHLTFFVSALLYWWAILRPGLSRDTFGLATLYILTTAMHTSLLGALLTFAPSAWYPVYEATAPAWGLTGLEDQQLGGLIMWVPAGFVYLAIALLLFAAWLRSLERPLSREQSLS